MGQGSCPILFVVFTRKCSCLRTSIRVISPPRSFRSWADRGSRRSAVTEVEALGLVNNTYLVFTSDNGYHEGVHRMGSGKTTAYEEDIRVPLILAVSVGIVTRGGADERERGSEGTAGRRGPALCRGREDEGAWRNLATAPKTFCGGSELRPHMLDKKTVISGGVRISGIYPMIQKERAS
jgi:hypothetical protein